MTAQFQRTLIERASHPYLSAGSFAWHFSKGKMSGDPVFVSLLQHGLIPDALRLIDLGCGQGLLASWLLEARALYESGRWPQHWPPAPRLGSIWGLDLMGKNVERARAALGDRACFDTGDVCSTEFGQAGVVIMFDVLHYLDYDAQEDILRRVRAALPVGGTFITRIGDAAGGLPFHYSNWVDRTVIFLREYRRARLYCRTLQDWLDLLKRTGFDVKILPVNRGAPFCNVTLIAKTV